MAYTTHGWHIRGTRLIDRPEGLLTVKCGGPGMCKECGREAYLATESLLDDPNPYDAYPSQFEPIDAQALHQGRNTLIKVYESFRRAGIEEHQAAAAIQAMMDAGLIFMERTPTP